MHAFSVNTYKCPFLVSRFSLATERLKILLDPLLCSETPNVMHMQNYLCYNKIPNESKEQPSAKIMSTYQVSNYECYSRTRMTQVYYFF